MAVGRRVSTLALPSAAATPAPPPKPLQTTARLETKPNPPLTPALPPTALPSDAAGVASATAAPSTATLPKGSRPQRQPVSHQPAPLTTPACGIAHEVKADGASTPTAASTAASTRPGSMRSHRGVEDVSAPTVAAPAAPATPPRASPPSAVWSTPPSHRQGSCAQPSLPETTTTATQPDGARWGHRARTALTELMHGLSTKHGGSESVVRTEQHPRIGNTPDRQPSTRASPLAGLSAGPSNFSDATAVVSPAAIAASPNQPLNSPNIKRIEVCLGEL